MLFKQKGQACTLNYFDLVGDDEVALAKIFAFVISKDKDIFSDFLKLCNIRTVITENVFKNSSISSEVYHGDKGRTDIEIDVAGKEYIIIETKVRSNKAKDSQLNTYQSIDKKFHIVLIFFPTHHKKLDYHHILVSSFRSPLLLNIPISIILRGILKLLIPMF